jgi:hypothetical protein
MWHLRMHTTNTARNPNPYTLKSRLFQSRHVTLSSNVLMPMRVALYDVPAIHTTFMFILSLQIFHITDAATADPAGWPKACITISEIKQTPSGAPEDNALSQRFAPLFPSKDVRKLHTAVHHRTLYTFHKKYFQNTPQELSVCRKQLQATMQCSSHGRPCCLSARRCRL